MDIFRSQFYRLNVTLLSLIGQWPYQKFRLWQLFQQIMCLISVSTVITSQGIRLFEIWGNFDIMIECLTPMAVQLAATIKTINFIIYQKNMKKLLETIKRDWSSLRNEKELEILTKYTEEGRNATLFYAGFLYGSLVMYLMIPLLPKILDVIVPLNESRTTVHLYETQYYVDPEEYFVWICLHTYSGTIVTVTTIIAVDTIFVRYVMHVCGVLAVIGYRLENLTSKRSDTSASAYIMSKDDDQRCYQEIAFCIDQHYNVIETIKIIESSHSLSYLLVIGISVILLSISGVQLLFKFGQVQEMIRLFQFNLAQFNHLFFNSWPCQKLIDQSVTFRDSLYAAEWYLLSEGNKHLLRFTMLRTLEPQKITAGKLYIMSMENFGAVIQTSMSYFTVFASIQ